MLGRTDIRDVEFHRGSTDPASRDVEPAPPEVSAACRREALGSSGSELSDEVADDNSDPASIKRVDKTRFQ